MAHTQQRSVVLILARELAANIANAVFLVDPDGALIYYNEAAERILGRTYADAGEMTAAEWGTTWAPTDRDGTPIPPTELPLAIAITQRRPAYRTMQISGLDGVRRLITITAYPLSATTDEFVGAAAIFWERSDASD